MWGGVSKHYTPFDQSTGQVNVTNIKTIGNKAFNKAFKLSRAIPSHNFSISLERAK